MEQAIEFREITSDDEASFLMPGNDGFLHIVLFCESGAPVVDRAREIVPEVEIPEAWDFAVIDTAEAPETVRWFGVDEASGMAVIRDGSLLDIEYECSIDAFGRLIATAKKQAKALENLG